MSSDRFARLLWSAALCVLCCPCVSLAQPAAVGVRQAPPPRPPAVPTRLAVEPLQAGGPSLALKYSSLDVFGDDTDAGGGSLYLQFGFANTSNGLLERLGMSASFDPVSSLIDDAGQRQTGIGDLWLRGGVKVLDEVGRRPSIAGQYSMKVPTASESNSLGSGHVDQRVSVLFDKNWPHAIWSNLGFMASFKGTDDTEPIRKIGSVVGQLEVPIRNRLTYQGSWRSTHLSGTPTIRRSSSTARRWASNRRLSGLEPA